jgi:hypothetical protein
MGIFTLVVGDSERFQNLTPEFTRLGLETVRGYCTGTGVKD